MNQSGFDRLARKTVGGETITYGILRGNERIVFIKSGAGGNINGYRDKYLRMARRARERLGATVICASNPFIGSGHVAADRAAIEQIAAALQLGSYTVDLVGTSDGAYHALLLAKELPQAAGLLAINPSLIDLADLRERLLALPQLDKTLVYGTKDEDYASLSQLSSLANERLTFVAAEGADHRFGGMVEAFVNLIDLLI
ncbi:MAG: alpha/beta hydrolase [Clostridia bacterium]|nr:alpha/beta hydrolase [Clostridia bacterium]